ncbi:MAG: hypothetical protein JWN44_5388 [Myxococcales bacterium]|nr:hypothetical protein [Myxococcales bacterium]
MKWHTIVALVAGKPAKTECHGCHKQHQYRAQPPASATGVKKPRAPKAPATTPAADFETVLAGRTEARAYSPNETFALGEVVRHPSFDVGVVTAAPAPQKIEVTFRDGKKILLHDRGGAAASKLGPAPRREEGAKSSGTSDSPRGIK